MKIKLNLKVLVLLSGLISSILPGHARAGIFPVANDPAVLEFAGGAIVAGTNYLVAFVSGTNMAAQLVSGDGQLIGSPQIVGANPGFPPAAALAGAKTNGLVAWSDNSIGSGVTMFGQIVAANGSPVGAKFPLLASAGAHGFQFVQAAASDGTNFLVVWQDAADTNFYGQLVTGSGTLLAPEFNLFSASNGLNDRDVTVVFGRTNYLVAWQSGANNSNNTYGELISPSGNVGSSFQLNASVSLEKNPTATAFDGTNYLVVWNRTTNNNVAGWPDWNLCGRLLSQSGTVLGNELVLVTEEATFPALAFDGANYLLAWGFDATTTNTDTSIHARFLDRSANAIGPIFTPFSTVGTNPPLLPINGVLFDGARYLLTATFGSFVVSGNGDVNGLLGGDVYGRFLPASTQPPIFTEAAVAGGLFHGNLKVVPGQRYTIEVSTNLTAWAPVDSISSTGTNVLTLNDPRAVTNFSGMFYRAAIGNSLPPAFSFNFHEFANAGGFGGGYTPAPSYPVSLANYAAVFEVQNDFNLPAAGNVFFTGPGGSGLTNAAADPNNSYVNSSDASYQSPFVSPPAAAPGGTWTVNYHGTNITFNVSDPQAASRLVIPLPTVTVSGGIVQSVSWSYKDAATGADLGGAPAYVTGIQVQIEGATGRIYDSPFLAPDVTSHTLASTVNWTDVSNIFMAYDDTFGNHYVVSFSKP